MKMFKKLMAVVLTGVMAVSMLTGCAFTDNAKAKALQDALNSKSLQETTKYTYEKDYNSKASKVYSQVFDGKFEKVETAYGEGIADVLSYNAKVEGYAYFVISAPTKAADAKKAGEWTATKLNTAVTAGFTSKVTDAGKKIDGAATGTASATNQNKAKFGVKFVDNGKSGDKAKAFAIVVFKLAA